MGSSVLIVDADRNEAETLARWFTAQGHDGRVATRGDTALAAAIACPPAIALVNLRLPDTDGLVLAQTLRQRFGDALYLAALVSAPQPDTVFRVFAARCDHYIVKPTSPHRLRFLLWDAGQHDRRNAYVSADAL